MDENLAQSWVMRRAGLQYLLVAALAAVVVFWNLGTAVMEDHECHLAITARTMAEGDARNWLTPSDKPYEVPPRTECNRWLVPVENGQPRLVKTPLPYWSAAALAIVGGSNNWTTRTPAAAFAVLLAVLTLAVGRRMFSPRAALLGAVMLATCLGFQKWGRDGRPEMTLCFMISAAMACFYLGTEARSRRGHVLWMAAFWITMGLANLAKEFVPLLLAWSLAAYVFFNQSLRDTSDESALRRLRTLLVLSGVGLVVHLLVSNIAILQWWQHVKLPGGRSLSEGKATAIMVALCLGGPMLWYLKATRGWKPAVRLLPTAVPGAAVMLAMFLPWMWYMTHLFPDVAGKVFADQVTDRAGGEGKWSVAPWYVYFAAVVTLSLPWVSLLPGALAAGLMKRFAAHRRPLVFLLLWCVGMVMLFTSTAAKREHYILPMIPPLCLLLGFIAEDVFFKHEWFKPAIGRLIGVAYGIVGAGGAIAMTVIAIVKKGETMYVVLAIAAAVAAVPWLLAALSALRGRLAPVIGLLVAGMAIIYVGHWTFIDRFDPRKPIADFAREARAIVGDQPVYHWGDPQSKTVFYFGRNIPVAHWPFELAVTQENKGAELDAEDVNRQAEQRLIDHLKKNPNDMPWLIGYGMSADLLKTLGYAPVLQKQDIQAKRLLFTLYRRQP